MVLPIRRSSRSHRCPSTLHSRVKALLVLLALCSTFFLSDLRLPILTSRSQNLYSQYLAASLEGGVLPIRRFTVTDGSLIRTIDKTTIEDCNYLCLKEIPECMAWEFRAKRGQCLLFEPKTDGSILSIYQADDNDPSYIVGFPQKHAAALQPAANPNEGDRKDKILYILHFHHDVHLDAFQLIMNQILPSSWPSNFDIVPIAPRAVDLTLVHGVTAKRQSLINPFRGRSVTSPRGANGYTSLPIAKTKFPGYKGYVLVNDDAMIRFWKLSLDKWFGAKPWVTFAPFQYSKMEQQIRTVFAANRNVWSWFKYDSGTVGASEAKDITPSNFNATLNALNELCLPQSGIRGKMEDWMVKEFCKNREPTLLYPYNFGGGKADLLYVPGNELGETIFKAIALFGEHDSMMEIGWPTIVSTILPRDQVLEMPCCTRDSGKSNATFLEFTPVYQPVTDTATELKDVPCPTIHPIKFSHPTSFAHWKNVVEQECPWCTWKEDGNTEIHWKLIV